ncbi:MAG: glycosyltransferase family 4 protein [Planctomycetales bacterium]|nr:glycosyltransferase family 4 protein [Planctomycetales bacterium]
MRFVAVTDTFDLGRMGGATRVLWETARALRRLGHETTIVGGGDDAGEETRERIVVRRARWRGRESGFRELRPFLREIGRLVEGAVRESRAAATWLHQPLSAGPALRAASRVGVPSVYVFHSPWPAEIAAEGRRGLRAALGRAVRSRVERAVVRGASRVVTLSRAMAGECASRHGIPADRIRVIPGGADPVRFAPPADREALRRELGVPSGATLLVAVRRLIPRTGIEDLLRAVAALRGEFPGLQVAVAGDGPLRESLAAAASSLGLGDAARLLGAVPEADLPRWYGAADLAVVPTRELEGFGLAAVEALACGTPTLATPVGGLPEILADLDPGLLAPGTGPSALTSGLRPWIARPEALATLRPRCAAYARERFTWDRAAAALVEVVESAVAEGKGRPA